MAQIYRCKKSFALGVRGGVPRVIPADKVVSSDDPVLAGRQDLLNDPTLFEPIQDYIDRTVGGVEQATAEPGEKRTVTRPARRGAGKSKGKTAETKAAETKTAETKTAASEPAGQTKAGQTEAEETKAEGS